ncbi:hypothetical protein LOTGIDRAFT_212290 [Lottia gigantea]|uniref:Leishmanolysin-like peptidase n=1 Tax=Lottia gigantea TaxID=225164 RepID=V4B5E8_LOTGI|nr:hypothetical protein LOTGIDRAFT_212290 [Lottia gigantea]ESP02771.1 hypothetical protein LOTGIDRAFT_212290 [Lottia gigantea]
MEQEKRRCYIFDVYILLTMGKLLEVDYYIIGISLLMLKISGLPTIHTCNHLSSLNHEIQYDVDIEPVHIVKKRSINHPLRIHLHYDTSLDLLPPDHVQLLKETAIEAVSFWSKTLWVRQTAAPIRLKRKCENSHVGYRNQISCCYEGCSRKTVCGEIEIPNEHLEECNWCDDNREFNDYNSKTGVSNTDFILYVAAIKSDRCLQSTVAYAGHCQQERALDRPVAGYFSICPQSISTNKQDRLQLLSTLKHEILHALGFTASLFAFYRNENGEPLTPRQEISNKPEFDSSLRMYKWSANVVKTIRRPDWRLPSGTITKTVRMIVTPKVREEVRRHFNCSTLEGAELEDQGIDGTAITHWEKRVFENEAMTGTYTQSSVISRITLAAMEDTGWFKANYSQAGHYEWGKGLGCDFVKQSCYHWMVTREARNEDIYPYCKKVKTNELWTDCTDNRHSVALCNLVEYKQSLPRKFQYFNGIEGVADSEVGRFGGSVSLADYCPYLQEFSWTNKDEILRGSSCLVHSNGIERDTNYFGEEYGNNSLCLNHGGKWYLHHCGGVNSPQHSGSGCYRYVCSSELGLTVIVDNKPYRCYKSGQRIKPSFITRSYLHQGSIICPSCHEVCDVSMNLILYTI